MKRVCFLILVALFLTGSQAWSQLASLTVFSAKGEKFILEVNGKTQNAKPEARVYTENLGGPMIKVKVLLEETAIPPVTKTVMNKPNASFIYVLQKDEKGKYVLQQTATDWSSEVKSDSTGATAPPPPPPAAEQKSETKEVKAEKGARCQDPMPDAEFYSSIGPMSHQPFDPPRLNSAKSLAQKHCLSSFQVLEVLHIFDYEKSRLDFAKFAYDLVFDPTNYEQVYSGLNNSSVAELKKYIEAKGK